MLPADWLQYSTVSSLSVRLLTQTLLRRSRTTGSKYLEDIERIIIKAPVKLTRLLKRLPPPPSQAPPAQSECSTHSTIAHPPAHVQSARAVQISLHATTLAGGGGRPIDGSNRVRVRGVRCALLLRLARGPAKFPVNPNPTAGGCCGPPHIYTSRPHASNEINLAGTAAAFGRQAKSS